MTRHDWTRREFLQTSAGSAAGLALAPLAVGREIQEGGVEYRILGKTGLRVSLLGYGSTAIIGDRADQDRVDRLMNMALDHGLNSIDTAECYAGSEEKIGSAIARRREEYYIFSKVGHEHGWSQGQDWSAKSIERTIEQSLRRLKTDYLDVVHLHSCSEKILRRGDAIDAIERAKQQGKVRFIGYSGDSTAARYAVETDRFDTLMTSVSVLDQEAIDLTLPLCREKNMGLIIKRPIANAVFRYDMRPESRYHHEYWERMNELNYPFTRGEQRESPGPNGAAGIFLRFTASTPGVHTIVVGTRSPGRWKSNNEILRAGPLPAEQYEAIRTRWREMAPASWVGQV